MLFHRRGFCGLARPFATLLYMCIRSQVDVWLNISYSESGRANDDLCIDGKSGFSHGISCLHSFVHRILTNGRSARKLSFVMLH